MESRQKLNDDSVSGTSDCCSRRSASGFYIFLVILTTVVYAGMLAVNGYYAYFMDTFNSNNSSNSSQLNYFEITPAPWAFSIWGLIFFWNALFCGYCITSLFTRYHLHRVPITVFPFFIISNLATAAWLVVADLKIYWAGVAVFYLIVISLYFCVIISRHSVVNHRCRYMIYTYMVDNAWAIFAGWTTVASSIYLGLALMYADDGPELKQTETGTYMLCIIMVEVIVFCPLELTILDKYLRHVWTHYIAVINALVASIIKNWDPNNRNSIITVAISGFVLCAFLVKIARILSSCCRRPDRFYARGPSNELEFDRC